MQTNTRPSTIDTILSSGHTSTITRNLAFPLRTAVHVFCEGPATDSPPRLLQPRGDFHHMATFAYADDADGEEENDTSSVSDDEEQEEQESKGVRFLTQFMAMLRRLQASVRGMAPTHDGQASSSGD